MMFVLAITLLAVPPASAEDADLAEYRPTTGPSFVGLCKTRETAYVYHESCKIAVLSDRSICYEYWYAIYKTTGWEEESCKLKIDPKDIVGGAVLLHGNMALASDLGLCETTHSDDGYQEKCYVRLMGKEFICVQYEYRYHYPTGNWEEKCQYRVSLL